MNQLKLTNKNIVISAAADGIGWCIAESCLNEGANVFISDIDENKLEDKKKHIKYNKNLFIHKVDSCKNIKVEEYFLELKKNINKIDALINNVGIAGPTGKLEDLQIEDDGQTVILPPEAQKALGLKETEKVVMTKIARGDKAVFEIKSNEN